MKLTEDTKNCSRNKKGVYMTEIYHLHLIANNTEVDTLFGTIPDKRDDMDAGWMHCAFDVRTLAEFVLCVLNKTDMGSKKAIRLIISQYTDRKSKLAAKRESEFKLYKNLISNECDWDANEHELSFINQGFEWEDREKLISYIVDRCEQKFGNHDKFMLEIYKRSEIAEKNLEERRKSKLE
jgi:hypothetical protein